MSAQLEHLETAGTFSLDGGTWEVENNVWIIGDAHEVVVLDPAHDAGAVAAQIGERSVRAILLTHGHDDHISQARDLAQRTGAPIYLHPADRMLWDQVYAEDGPDGELHDGDTFEIAGITLQAIHTPGHSPGSTCFYTPDLGQAPVLFSGDTLFAGGPGATGRSYSSEDTIKESILKRLFVLPASTVVHTGHGPSTTIGDELASSS